MDCRKALWLGVGALGLAVGCAPRQVAVAPPAPPVKTYMTLGDNDPPPPGVKRVEDLPPRTPHAKTCVAGGNFYAQEAEAAGLSEVERQADREKARKAFQQALKEDPHCLEAYESLGALYAAMKDYAHAVPTYEKGIKEFPKEPQLYYALGTVYGMQKQWGPAVENLGKAVELDPENRKYVNALGWMQVLAGRNAEALNTFLRVNTEAEARYRLARMLEHLGRTDECKQQLRAAVEIDPQFDPARLKLDKLEGRGEPVQQATYTEAAKPAAPAPNPTLLPPPPRSSGPRQPVPPQSEDR